ncbi:Organic cation transporter 1 [Armadillidium vulgare]|nr:Organic cation transporter 1 [Armadillidium vulgare]
MSEFKKVMNQIARTNGKTLSPEFNKLVIIAQKDEKKKVPISKILKSGVLAKHLFLVCILSMLGNMFYVGLEFNLHNMTGNTFVNFFILAVFEIPGSIIVSYCTDKFGRRLTSAVFGILSAACIILTIPFIYNKWAIVALCGISKSFIGGLFIGIYKQIGELFPTPLRATAYGITGIAGFASTVVVPSITALGAKDPRITYYFLFGFSLLITLFGSLVPETLGLPYPQTIREALLIGKDQSYFSIYYKGKVRNLFKPVKKNSDQEMKTV